MQSFLGFLNSSCWFTVGVRTGKVPVWGPNIIGMMLSLLQLAPWAMDFAYLLARENMMGLPVGPPQVEKFKPLSTLDHPLGLHCMNHTHFWGLIFLRRQAAREWINVINIMCIYIYTYVYIFCVYVYAIYVHNPPILLHYFTYVSVVSQVGRVKMLSRLGMANTPCLA